METDDRATALRALESWNAGDRDGYLGMHDRTVRAHGYMPEPMDDAELVAFCNGIFEAFPEPKLIADDVRVGHHDPALRRRPLRRALGVGRHARAARSARAVPAPG